MHSASIIALIAARRKAYKWQLQISISFFSEGRFLSGKIKEISKLLNFLR